MHLSSNGNPALLLLKRFGVVEQHPRGVLSSKLIQGPKFVGIYTIDSTIFISLFHLFIVVIQLLGTEQLPLNCSTLKSSYRLCVTHRLCIYQHFQIEWSKFFYL